MRFAWVFLFPLLAAAAESHAVAISSNIQLRHMPHGTVLDPVFAARDSDQIVSYSRCGDSAIWTGHYLAAEAFRYKVTGSAEALAFARRAFAGIKSLVDVTGTNLLARCIVPVESPYAKALTDEESRHGVFRNTAQEPNYFWIGNTSRDQYSGVMFGLAVAYDMIDDAALRADIRALVRRIVDFLRGHEWIVRMPNGDISTTFIGRADQQLAFLQIARHLDPDRYSTAYDINRVLLSAAVPAPIGIEVLDNNSYFKFNLDTINLYNLIRLESSSFNSIYRRAYDTLRRHTDNHGNAFFNMVDRALNGANAVRDAETLRMLDEWLLRPRRDPYIDLRNKYPVCGREDETCNPIPIAERVRTDFLWQRNPFLLYGGAEGKIETAGIDYILPYWMARSFQLASPEARSAASGAIRVSPESIASLYGSDLAGVTRLDVRDAAGGAHTAQIFFTSPGQVNFVIPASVPVGTAMLSITSGGPARSASLDVHPVAPAIFTANGSGTGVAAALVESGRAGTAPSLIFQCASAGQCSAIPVDPVQTPFLSLYGTGIRGRRTNAQATIGGAPATVLYAGPQSQFPGLDQVNLQIPPSLRGAGEVDVVVTVDGQAANAVRLRLL